MLNSPASVRTDASTLPSLLATLDQSLRLPSGNYLRPPPQHAPAFEIEPG